MNTGSGRRPQERTASSTWAPPWPTTTTIESGRTAAAARASYHSAGRPQTSCSTFGRVDFIRFPLPAARMTTARRGEDEDRDEANAGRLSQPRAPRGRVGQPWLRPVLRMFVSRYRGGAALAPSPMAVTPGFGPGDPRSNRGGPADPPPIRIELRRPRGPRPPDHSLGAR